MASITDEHLRRLAELAKDDRDGLFGRKPYLAVYRDRILVTALCQGAALHFVNGLNGVKDLDVYTFYAEDARIRYPYRRRGIADFGASEHGYHPDDHDLVDRRVDTLGRALKVSRSADPVAAVRHYLQVSRTRTARELARKAVVVVDAGPTFGKVVWPSS